jgi:acyl-CoA synthetase (AMP-forming)/AMP-acid ligase II
MMLVHEIVAGNARRRPESVAWRFQGRAWRWGEVAARTDRLCLALQAMGFSCGDRVGVFAENSHLLAELYFALPRIGLIVVPINPRCVAREVAFILQDVGARALLVSARLAERVAGAALPVEMVLGLEDGSGFAETVERLIARGGLGAIDEQRDPDAIRAIKYTSGTTGQPKGCISTQRQFIGNFLNYLIQLPFTREDHCLLPLPMTAGVGIQMLTAYAYAGAETLILDRFDAAAALDAIETHGITRFYAMPTMLAALADEQERQARDLRSLRLIGYGGQAAPVSLVRRAMEVLGCGFYQTFGASEAGGFVLYLMPLDHARLRDGGLEQSDSYGRSIVPCGAEVQGFHVRIVDDARGEVAEGEIGELAIRCDSLMSGYWKRPEQTAENLVESWLYTGDLARRDAEGLVTIVDRKRDMIVSGGYNVYSAEVEAVLHEHPAVQEAAVIGVADPYWGESVHAYVVRRPDAVVDEAALLDFMTERVASYKRPKRFVFIADMPRTSSGKMRKVELRKLHERTD